MYKIIGSLLGALVFAAPTQADISSFTSFQVVNTCSASVKFLPGFSKDISLCMKPTTNTTLPYATPFTISWDFVTQPDCAAYANAFSVGASSFMFAYVSCQKGDFVPHSPQLVTTKTGSLTTTGGPCPVCDPVSPQSSVDIYLAGSYNGTTYAVGGVTVNLSFPNTPSTQPNPPKLSPSAAPITPTTVDSNPSAIFPSNVNKPVTSPVGSGNTLSNHLTHPISIITMLMMAVAF
ncbi:hypothetical protein K7432_003065 [Basidiobolus ranarum]|uniref:Uncharacterized protein n=1 Tax=Basidiobolus ranarum TaxID=34480 RepID=A0ABR2W6Y1_9FUNG